MEQQSSDEVALAGEITQERGKLITWELPYKMEQEDYCALVISGE